ncbi:hypothetical protein BS732_1711 [Bacillus subtilis MB73/2]|nr:hypothetical protein BS732_1711 [Bacillus subtilis MB73/2]
MFLSSLLIKISLLFHYIKLYVSIQTICIFQYLLTLKNKKVYLGMAGNV